MLKNNQKHVIIIGGGIGGYTAALEACERGWRATLIEQDKWGGTCLQRGCVPMKFLLEKVHKKAPGTVEAWQQEKEDLLKELTYGLQYRLEKAKVNLVCGSAKVLRAQDEVLVEIRTEDGAVRQLKGDYLLLATGAHTVLPPVLEPYASQIWSTTELLTAENLPEQVVIIGAGVSGVECAEYLALLGVKTTLVEQCEQILPGWDIDVAEEVVAYLEEELDVQCYIGYNVCQINPTDVGHLLILQGQDGEQIPVEAERILACTGKEGNVSAFSHLGIVDANKDRILVNKQQRTMNSRIYAVGDCTLGRMTAHGAAWEAKQAIRRMTGEEVFKPHGVSEFLSVNPPACRAGMTEDEAKAQGYLVSSALMPLYGNGKAAILGQSQGLIKVVADQTTGRILGIHMYGPHADELLNLASFIVEQENTVVEIESMAFAHPTVGEYIQEAVKKL